MKAQNEKQKQVKKTHGFTFAQGDLSIFERKEDSDISATPLSGSYFERKDTESFAKYIEANYENGKKIAKK